MAKRQNTYSRARMEILQYICQHVVVKDYHKTIRPMGDNPCFNMLLPTSSTSREFYEKYIGCLVQPYGVYAANKYYLSWLVDVAVTGNDIRFLLRTIEDGDTAWASNIALNVFYDGHKCTTPEDWKWNDKQFAFYDKWKRVLSRSTDLITTAGVYFDNKHGVTIKIRERGILAMPEENNWRFAQSFMDYRKVLSSELDSAINKALEDYKTYRGAK